MGSIHITTPHFRQIKFFSLKYEVIISVGSQKVKEMRKCQTKY
nr:MAG TPA: hypothetical protein [Caudoviricetes sp.]